MSADTPARRNWDLMEELPLRDAVRALLRGPLAALEAAAGQQDPGGDKSPAEFDPAALLASIEDTLPGTGDLAARLKDWARSRDEGDSVAALHIGTWLGTITAFLDPAAVRMGRRCPVCHQDEVVTPAGTTAALWVTWDLGVCLACHRVARILELARVMERDGARFQRKRKKVFNRGSFPEAA